MKPILLYSAFMRLTAREIQAIKQSVYDLDPHAQVYLFGSRVDPNLSGGDIDLLVLSKTLLPEQKRVIRRAILNQIGEQKLDIVLAQDDSEPFVRIALLGGVLL